MSNDSINSIIKIMKDTVLANLDDVAKLGDWDDRAKERLVNRIPKEGCEAPGADAGIFAALGLIPGDYVEFVAKFHGGRYTEELINQVREEYEDFMNGGEGGATAYWLLASRFCEEGGVTAEYFISQVQSFETLRDAMYKDRSTVKNVIEASYKEMTESFGIFDGVPFSSTDGALHGAYIAGHPFGVLASKEYGIFFIGTYHDSLGLEDFEFGDETQFVNGVELPKSGAIGPQYAKVAGFEELSRAIQQVKRTLL